MKDNKAKPSKSRYSDQPKSKDMVAKSLQLSAKSLRKKIRQIQFGIKPIPMPTRNDPTPDKVEEIVKYYKVTQYEEELTQALLTLIAKEREEAYERGVADELMLIDLKARIEGGFHDSTIHFTLRVIETLIKQTSEEAYERGWDDGFGNTKRGLAQARKDGQREILERVKLETDACVCECGEKWSETDLADYVNEKLKEMEAKYQELNEKN